MAHIRKFALASITSAAIFIMLPSCGHNHSIADEVASAELSLANEDVNATRNLCSGILTRAEKEGMEASQYGRLSILYMQLNDRSDDPEDLQLATNCYREAFKINADSALAFYSSLPVEQDKYAMTLASIVHTLDNPREIPEDHDWEVSPDEIGKVEDPAAMDSIASAK